MKCPLCDKEIRVTPFHRNDGESEWTALYDHLWDQHGDLFGDYPSCVCGYAPNDPSGNGNTDVQAIGKHLSEVNLEEHFALAILQTL